MGVRPRVRPETTTHTHAAKRAGYAESGLSVTGTRLLAKPSIQQAVAEAEHLKAKVNEISIERVLEEYRRLAFFQTTDMVTLKGGWVQIKDTESLTVEQRSAISQIRQNKDGELEVKFYDKTKALDSLAKYLGMFNEKLTLEHHFGCATP